MLAGLVWPDGPATLLGRRWDRADDEPQIERFEPSGASTFAPVELGGRVAWIIAAAGDDAGRVVAAGYVRDPVTEGIDGVLMRLADEALDPTFGTGGLSFADGVSFYVDLAIASNGTIVAVGLGDGNTLVIRATEP